MGLHESHSYSLDECLPAAESSIRRPRIRNMRHNLVDLLRQNPMQRVLGAGPKIGQTLSLPRLLLPANDAPVFDQEERTAVPRGHALLLGGRNHVEDFQFGLRF